MLVMLTKVLGDYITNFSLIGPAIQQWKPLMNAHAQGVPIYEWIKYKE